MSHKTFLLLIEQELIISAGSLTLTGAAPSVYFAYKKPGVGSLQLQSSAPTTTVEIFQAETPRILVNM